MKVLEILPVALLAVALVSCSGDEQKKEEQASQQSAAQPIVEEATVPEMVDGVQVVHITVEDVGYTPSRIKLKEGIPARLVFDQHGTHECSSQIQSPDFGVKVTDLPQGKQTPIEFTPDKTGEFAFACGMDMLTGVILVEK